MKQPETGIAPLRVRVVAMVMVIQAWLIVAGGLVLIVAALLHGIATSAGFVSLFFGLVFGGVGWLFRSLALHLRRLSDGARWTVVFLAVVGLITVAAEIPGSKGSQAVNLLVLIPEGLLNVAVVYLLALDGKVRSAFKYGPVIDDQSPAPDVAGLASTERRSTSLLKVDNLNVSFPTSDGVVQAVRGLSFEVSEGQTLGIVGESGSGKSVTALTLLGLNPGADIEGSATFDGKNLLGMDPRNLRRLRGNDIAMIFQDPLSSLHPHFRVGWQIVEAIRAHADVSKGEARARTVELFRAVKIPEPERRINAFPHELSGGMRQRVMIAMALALKPKLLIADEPTTALDATVQAQLLELLTNMQKETGMAMIMITHDLGVVASIADSVMVMYAGRAAEVSKTRTLFYEPHHPYTLGLLRSIPTTGDGQTRLVPIVGQPPSLISPPSGCAFHPRCPYAMDRCLEELPDLLPVSGGSQHTSACYLPPEIVGVDEKTNASRIQFSTGHQSAKATSLAGVKEQGLATDV